MTAERIQAKDVKAGWWIEAKIGDTWKWRRVVARSFNKHRTVIYLKLEDRFELSRDPEEYIVASDTAPQGIINRHDVPTWEEYFLALAQTVATRAKCRRRQVGAVITDAQNRIISTGYNGYPESKSDVPEGATPQADCLEGGCPRGLLDFTTVPPGSSYSDPAQFCIAVHAEENAVNYRSSDVKGGTIYVTDEPCYYCTKTLLSAGVLTAVWPNGKMLVRDLFLQHKEIALSQTVRLDGISENDCSQAGTPVDIADLAGDFDSSTDADMDDLQAALTKVTKKAQATLPNPLFR